MALTALALIMALVAGVPVAAAAPSLTCTGINPGASGVLDAAVSGTSSVSDSLKITESSGDYSFALTSGGSTSAVCTGTTYPDSGFSGFPTVEVTGGALLATEFEASTDPGLRFEGQNGVSNTLDLSSLPTTSATVSVPTGTLTVGSVQDSFSGITTFDGLASGNTAFLANSTGGYTFAGTGTGNALDLTSAGSGVTASVPGGTVTLAAGSDVFSGISNFVGSTSGGTTLVAGSNSLSFTGREPATNSTSPTWRPRRRRR